MSTYFQGLERMERLAKNVGRVVSLPIYPSMTDSEVGDVLSALRRGFAQGLR
jgi:dTDP-4-amino-4,6-dideoxygalactose transaminase